MLVFSTYYLVQLAPHISYTLRQCCGLRKSTHLLLSNLHTEPGGPSDGGSPSSRPSPVEVAAVGRKAQPWFKVQYRLALNPKFRKLSPSLKGHLLCLWCAAAAQNPRGALPSLPELAEYLGSTYHINMTRIISNVLKPLIQAGFIEYDESSNKYLVHDWAFWQSQNSSDGLGLGPSTVSSTVSSTVFQHDVDVGIVNKELPDELEASRYTEIQNSLLLRNNDSVRDLFDLENTGKTHTAKPGEKRKGGVSTSDPRLIPLKTHIESEWLSWRKALIGSCATNKDWIQVNRLLHRTNNDPKFSLEALKVSFTRFASSNNQYESRQGLSYWALNAHVWLQDKQPMRDYT